MVFANGADPLRAVIQPPRRQNPPLSPEQVGEKRRLFASDKIPISLGKNGVAQELQVAERRNLRWALERTSHSFFPNARTILGPQKIKQGPYEDGHQNEE